MPISVGKRALSRRVARADGKRVIAESLIDVG